MPYKNRGVHCLLHCNFNKKIIFLAFQHQFLKYSKNSIDRASIYREPRNILQTCIVWSRNLNILCTYRYIVPFCFHWPPTITVYRVLIVVLFDFWQKVPYFGGGGVARSAKTKSLGGTFCTIWGGPPENFENQKVQRVLFVQRVVISWKNRKNKKYPHFEALINRKSGFCGLSP